jgi:hypothetical protein
MLGEYWVQGMRSEGRSSSNSNCDGAISTTTASAQSLSTTIFTKGVSTAHCDSQSD